MIQEQATGKINVRLKFSKGNEVKYISHLDLMRTFQRAMRRADIPIAYSSGFNPHQEISFGAPLALGVSSNAEYLDMRLIENININILVEKLNNVLPKGIKVLDGAILVDKAKNAMSLVTHSKYRICMSVFNTAKNDIEEKILAFLNQPAIIALKQQPKKDFEVKEIDIKPMIVSLKISDYEGDRYCLECLLLSGSKANLKPELMLDAFKKYSNYDIKAVRINRDEVYTEIDGQLVDLLKYAEQERR